MENILIVKMSALGDILHTLPCLALLRDARPDDCISWLVEKRHSSILAGHPLIDRVIPIDTKAWRRKFYSPAALQELWERIAELRRAHVSTAFDFQGLLKSGFFAAVSGASLRIGFPWGGSRETLSRLFINKTYTWDPRVTHVIEQNLTLVKNWLGRTGEVTIEFPLAPAFTRDAGELFPPEVPAKLPEKRFVILNPGAGWPTKQWPAAKYAELASLILKETTLSVFVSYGPGEEPLAEAIRRLVPGERMLTFPTTLPELASLLRRAEVFVGGDTGPFHLAVAVGTPVVGIFGPTDPARNGSIRADDIHVVHRLDCAPCYERECKTETCIRAVPVQEVFSALLERIRRARQARRD